MSKTTEGGISIIWVFLVFVAGTGTFFCPQDTVSTASGRAQTAASVTLNRLCSHRQKDVWGHTVKDTKTSEHKIGWKNLKNAIFID